MKTKIILLVCGIILLSTTVFAQTDTIKIISQPVDEPVVSLSAEVGLFSRFIWRGLDLGKGPSIQPLVTTTWKGFTLGATGAYSLSGTGDMETDFFLSKEIGFVTLTIADVGLFNDKQPFNYFDYQKSTTNHFIDGQILLSGGDKIPFNLLGSYLFYGLDVTKSIYIEGQYAPSLHWIDIMFFAGYQVKGTWYGENRGFVNLGCTFKKYLEIEKCF